MNKLALLSIVEGIEGQYNEFLLKTGFKEILSFTLGCFLFTVKFIETPTGVNLYPLLPQ